MLQDPAAVWVFDPGVARSRRRGSGLAEGVCDAEAVPGCAGDVMGLGRGAQGGGGGFGRREEEQEDG